jgi:EAL domain-containing protein (putative c-di-GMP-specific phosphodiesterase class I)
MAKPSCATDVALYRAKQKGRACVELFDESMRQEVMARLALETDLRRALMLGEISVCYQPQIVLKESRLVGFEALARWNNVSRGSIPTPEFIALAEKTGLIIPIGEWILREACRQMREWQVTEKGAADLRISVNLSALQLQQTGLVNVVKCVLEETGLAPRYLCLEITESTFFVDPESATKTLQELKALGVQLELDDFGTGYSSLSRLGRLPLDGLKIDCAFTARLEADNDDAVVRSILDLADRLRLHVVAEGVETESQKVLLTNLGCQIGQGYHYSRPMPPTAVKRYLEQQ